MTQATLTNMDVLLQNAINGDQNAYENFYHLALPLIKRTISKWIRNPVVIEDLSQEVLLKIHVARQTFMGDKAEQWICRITRNCVYDYLRKIRRNREQVSEMIAAESGYDQEKSVAIKEAVTSLSKNERELFDAMQEKGFNKAKFAKKTKLSDGAIRVRICRLRKALQHFGLAA